MVTMWKTTCDTSKS